MQLDVEQRRLLIDGQSARLGARAFDVLLALIERRDRTVGKNELFDLVWPGLVVEENNPQVHVSALRKLLGPQAITTIPGRGYCFTLDDSGSAPQPVAAPPAPPLPAQGPARTPGNLPARLPELYGRAEDVRAVRESLVSIVGAGGIGKTRLALEVGSGFSANDSDGLFADGVWWIELAVLSDPAMVRTAVAQVLGVSRTAERPLADTLVAVLREAGKKLEEDAATKLAFALD